MSANQERSYWRTNKDWYYIDDEGDRYVLRSDAPERAKKSFLSWKIGWGNSFSTSYIEDSVAVKQ